MLRHAFTGFTTCKTSADFLRVCVHKWSEIHGPLRGCHHCHDDAAMEYATAVKDRSSVAAADTVQKSLQTLMITTFLTPITTQSYMPIIPLLLTTDFDEPITRVGQLFFTLAFGSAISFMMMSPLLARFKTRHVLMGDFLVRVGAGVIWVYAVRGSMGTTPAAPVPAHLRP